MSLRRRPLLASAGAVLAGTAGCLNFGREYDLSVYNGTDTAVEATVTAQLVGEATKQREWTFQLEPEEFGRGYIDQFQISSVTVETSTGRRAEESWGSPTRGVPGVTIYIDPEEIEILQFSR